MKIELLTMIPVGQTFVIGFFAIMAATKALKASANYALTKEKNEVLNDNVNFTNSLGRQRHQLTPFYVFWDCYKNARAWPGLLYSSTIYFSYN